MSFRCHGAGARFVWGTAGAVGLGLVGCVDLAQPGLLQNPPGDAAAVESIDAPSGKSLDLGSQTPRTLDTLAPPDDLRSLPVTADAGATLDLAVSIDLQGRDVLAPTASGDVVADRGPSSLGDSSLIAYKDVADAFQPDLASPADAAIDAADASAYPCPCSLWPTTSVPTVEVSFEPPGAELGVRFKSDIAGKITALRFFKVVENSGVHIANLWATNGTPLATATFSNETPSGWQQIAFPSPVSIAAGVSYIASYHTTTGRFAHTGNFFNTMGRDAPPLHAARAATGSENGIFKNGPSAFPSENSFGQNYWVDVVFEP